MQIRGILFDILKGAFSIFLVINAIFFMFQILPGDPAVLISGEGAPEEQVEKIRRELGLDLPLGQRYKNTMLSLVTLNFGKSIFRQTEVKDLLLPRIRNTFKLAAFTITLVLLESAILFLLYMRFRSIESIMVGLTTFLYSIPNFWLGILLIILISVKLRLLPMSGYEGLRSLILPSLTLSISLSVVLSRFIKNTAEHAMASDFSRFLRAKGVYGLRFYAHIAATVLPVTITVIGLQIGVLLSGVVVTESVFSFPGIGSLMVESVLSRDFPVTLGCVFVVSSIWVVVNLLVDILVRLSDPRLR